MPWFPPSLRVKSIILYIILVTSIWLGAAAATWFSQAKERLVSPPPVMVNSEARVEYREKGCPLFFALFRVFSGRLLCPDLGRWVRGQRLHVLRAFKCHRGNLPIG
jgi:hypothetical protein